MINDLLLVLQLAIGLIFLLSSSGKLLNPVGFARGVREYRMLPESAAYAVGLLLIPLEFFLALSHLTGYLFAFAAPIGLGTFVTFMAGVGINLKRGRALSCYCFGDRGDEMISRRTLARLVLLSVAELLLLANDGRSSASQLVYPDRATSITELGIALVWALLFLITSFWLLNANEIIKLFRPASGEERKSRSSIRSYLPE